MQLEKTFAGFCRRFLSQVSRVKDNSLSRQFSENFIEPKRRWQQNRVLIFGLVPLDPKLESSLSGLYLGPRDGSRGSNVQAMLGWGSRYPRRDNPELTMTKAATKRKPPTTPAANFSASAESDLERNRQRTVIAENSLMALSPPNPKESRASEMG